MYYVYVIFDPRTSSPTPIYVGKGKGKRVRDHFGSSRAGNKMLRRIIKKCGDASLPATYKIVERFTDEADAFAYEIALIKKYGRRDLGEGMLCNLSDGGLGGLGGRVSAAQIVARRATMLRMNTSPETRSTMVQRSRELMRRLNADPDFKERMKEIGKKTVKTLRANREWAALRIERQRETMRRLHADPEYRKINNERLRLASADPIAIARRTASSSERMIRLNADLKFQARCKAGHAAYWAARKAVKSGEDVA